MSSIEDRRKIQIELHELKYRRFTRFKRDMALIGALYTTWQTNEKYYLFWSTIEGSTIWDRVAFLRGITYHCGGRGVWMVVNILAYLAKKNFLVVRLLFIFLYLCPSLVSSTRSFSRILLAHSIPHFKGTSTRLSVWLSRMSCLRFCSMVRARVQCSSQLRRKRHQGW